MKLAFMPGKLFLEKRADGMFYLTLQDEEILVTDKEKKAVKTYNEIRKEMEEKYPPKELSVEEKRIKFFNWVYSRLDVSREAKKPGRKYQPGSTKTFG